MAVFNNNTSGISSNSSSRLVSESNIIIYIKNKSLFDIFTIKTLFVHYIWKLFQLN